MPEISKHNRGFMGYPKLIKFRIMDSKYSCEVGWDVGVSLSRSLREI